MLNNAFERFRTQLHILQLEEYSVIRYIRWNLQNLFVKNLESKKTLVWTPKAKRLYAISTLYSFAFIYILLSNFGFLGLLIALVISYLYIPLLILSVVTLKPYELVNRQSVKRKIRKKILYLKSKGLKIIGITGSYGKTTIKEYLYTILSSKYTVLKTPDSYNTLFGIASVVDLELDENYDFFICEMGAYKKGEIAELCSCILPDHAILTGINEQHIERFGSISNTIEAKFELIKAIPKDGISVMNIDNHNIRTNYQRFTSKPILYGSRSPSFIYKEVRMNSGITSALFEIDGNSIKVQCTGVFGLGSVSNLLGASVMAYKLGVDIKSIEKSYTKLKPSKHRLEITQKEDGTTVIDDSYSSNVDGFRNALTFLNSFNGRSKVLVTPGIVELGKFTNDIHRGLGDLADKVCDIVILVGKTDRTDSLASHIEGEKVYYIDSIYHLKNKLSELQLKTPVVLIENDLPEHYIT